VGAFLDTNSKGVQAGAVYIFERNQGGVNLWGEVKKGIADDGVEQGLFGFQLDLDKDTLVVSSPGFSGVPDAAYVLERNRGGSNNWGLIKKITTSDSLEEDRFGSKVALSGNTIGIGASNHDEGSNVNVGAVYIYE
jgi:hypothetical protein